MPKYRGNGCRSAGKRDKGYLGAFSGAGYARDRGLGFSPEAAPSWDADALFRMDPARTRGNETKRISRNREDYLMVLDIMTKESYLLQGAIYSNRQTIVSYYNRNKIGQ